MRSPVDVVLEADTSFHVPTSFSLAICAKAPAYYETKNIRRFQKPPTEELPGSEQKRGTRFALRAAVQYPSASREIQTMQKCVAGFFALAFTIGARLGRGPIGRTPHC
jgi:hypothetical protein